MRRIEQERGDERNNVRRYDKPRARPICVTRPPVTRFVSTSKDDFEKKPCGK